MGNGQRKLLRVGVGLLKREFVFYCPDRLECEPGATVVLGRSYGIDFGEVIGPEPDTGQEVTESALRLASAEDLELIEASAPSADDGNAFRMHAEGIGLQMRLAGIDRSLDRSKITFYYTAEGRVDFRELVKRLTREFQCRVELYQLNLEDQFKRFPTCGICGIEVCCRKISGIFGVKVPTRVCKDQKLSYNPVKMAGCCGKARCCYLFEHVNYAEFAEALPKQGGRLKYRGHEFKLSDWDVFTRTVRLWSPEAAREVEIPWDEFKSHFGKDCEPVELAALLSESRERSRNSRQSKDATSAIENPAQPYEPGNEQAKDSDAARPEKPRDSRPTTPRFDHGRRKAERQPKKLVRQKPGQSSRIRRKPPFR